MAGRWCINGRAPGARLGVLALVGALVGASVGVARGASDPAVAERVMQGVACIEAKEMACAIALLEPQRVAGEDSLLQAVVHYSLAVAYRSTERPVDAIEMHLAVVGMKETPRAQRKQSEAALAELLALDDSPLEASQDGIIKRLLDIEQRRSPSPRWRGRLAYARAGLHEALGQYEQAVAIFDHLAQQSEIEPVVARRARERVEQIEQAHVAQIVVPCLAGAEVYFALQPLMVPVAGVAGGERGAAKASGSRRLGPGPLAAPPPGVQCATCWHRCSSEAVVVRPGRHSVVIWHRSEAAVEGLMAPQQRAVVARRGQPVELSYLLDVPPPVQRSSTMGVLAGGTLVVAGVVSHIVGEAEDIEAGRVVAYIGYGAGGALLLGEVIRWALDRSERRQRATVDAMPSL